MLYTVTAINENHRHGAVVGVFTSLALALRAIRKEEQGYGCKLSRMVKRDDSILYLYYAETAECSGSEYQIREYVENRLE